MRDVSARAGWAEWATEAFARATASDAPVVLLLTAAWSAACRRLDDEVLTDPALVRLLDDSFVPVRVDVDVRPDIASRYGLGGWPSLLVLTPEGEPLTGGRDVTAPHLLEVLSRVLDVFRVHRTELREETAARSVRPRSAVPAGRGALPATDAPTLFARRAAELVDGPPTQWADGAWANDPTVITALLASAASGVATALESAQRLVEHGLFRRVDPDIAGIRGELDGAGVQYEERGRHLHVNAAFIEVLLDAATLTGRDDYYEAAVRLLRFLIADMTHPAGGFVRTWSPPESEASRPVRDLRRFVDANAMAVRTCLRAARSLENHSLVESALEVVEQVIMPAYERGAGLAHLLDPTPRVRGLLRDQVAASAALLEAFEATGMQVYVDLAEELMRSVIRKYWNEAAGALADRVPTAAGAGDVGLLGRPQFPLSTNCAAAGVLLQLGHVLAAPDLRAVGLDILGAYHEIWAESGPGAAHYVLAVIEASREPR